MLSSSLLNSGSAFGRSTPGNLVLSGLAGGVASQATGGKFWQGFGTGVTVAGLNHLAHADFGSRFGGPPEGTVPTADGRFLDMNTGIIYNSEGMPTGGILPGSQIVYDESGRVSGWYPANGRIDQDYTIESILFPISKAKSVIIAADHLRKNNNWLRIKRSYNANERQAYKGIQWGAHPKHAQHIKPQWLRDFNQWLRSLGGGHWDMWKTK
jgi:hypothetical protein